MTTPPPPPAPQALSARQDGPSSSPSGAGLRGIARGSLLNLLGAAVSASAGIVLTLLVTRSTAKSSAGVFFTVTSLFLLAEMVACLGTTTGLVYFTARARSLGQEGRVRVYQRVALTPAVLVAVLAAVVLAAFPSTWARLVGGGTQAHGAVVVLGLLLPVAVLSDILLAATRGHATMLPTVALERTTRPLVQLGLIAVALGSGSLLLLVGAWALPWVLSALAAGWCLHRLDRRQSGPGVTETVALPWREFWGFTWARALSSVVQLALQRLDIVLITVLIGPAHAAVYTVATRFLVVGQQTAMSVGTAAQPRLAALMARQDLRSTKAVYQSATAWIVLLTWPLYLTCAVYAGAVLSIFGRGYAAGTIVVEVLAGAMLFSTACGIVDMLLNMAGRTSWTLVNAVASLTVMVTVDVLLIPRLGILGAGIGWAAAIVVNNALPLSQLLLSLRLHPFGRATVRAAGLSALCFGVLPVAVRMLFPASTAAAVCCLLISGVLYVCVCLRWRIALGLPAVSALLPKRRRAPVLAQADATPTRGLA